jgi:hypothetical protein
VNLNVFGPLVVADFCLSSTSCSINMDFFRIPAEVPAVLREIFRDFRHSFRECASL